MFERFTDEARTVVRLAVEEARRTQAGRVGTQHLLLALLARPGCLSAQVLGRHELDRERAVTILARLAPPPDAGPDLDADALRAIGIDLDAVRARVEATFGEGSLDSPAGPPGPDGLPGRRLRPFGQAAQSVGGRLSPRAKKVLELSLREAIRLKQGSIADAHLLLGLLREGQGLAALVLREAGIDLAALREELDRDLREAG